MNNRKERKCFIVLVISLIFVLLTACSGQNDIATEERKIQQDVNEKKFKIVCTTYPQYDWVKQILGENPGKIEVVYLLKNGVDIHSYQPSAEDMIAISDCDLFIYVGGQSEGWLEEARKNCRNQNQKGIAMMEILGDDRWKEELVEGMQKEQEHIKEEYDEHIWLSLKNAERICQEISNRLEELDFVHQKIYRENTENYIKQLRELDKKYQDLIDSAKQKTILFADRFPFRYLVEDYGLEYYAAFVGCSAETEASFETIAFLAAKVEELHLSAIYRIETSDDSMAQTIINSTERKDQKILVLDSLQAVTEEEIEEGLCYLSVMEQNWESLKQGILR